jgi:hypothetical protein
MKKIFKFKIVLFLTILFVSCQENEILEPKGDLNISDQSLMRTNENDKPDVHTQIVLGEKLKNPYTVTNMQAAFNYYNSIVTNSKFNNRIVVANYLYVKIIPQTEGDLRLLDDLDKQSDYITPVMQDYPMDYEILTEGDYYVNPTDENDLYYPVYTVIPVGYSMPAGLNYEILDSLYEPSDEEYDVETISLFFAEWVEDLEVDGIFLTIETLPTYINQSIINQSGTPNYLKSKKFTPNGCIKVRNTDSNAPDPLMKAEISYGRFVFWHYTYTDNNGYYSGSHSYRGKVRIRAKWRGYTATIRKTWNEVLGFQVSDHLMTESRNSNGLTKIIEYTEPNQGIVGIDLQGGHLWFKGTVHNGLRKYVDYCNANGISQTISYANVWAWATGSDASTPMLYKYPQLPAMSTIANVGEANFWNVTVNSISGQVISLLPSHLRPDQIFAGLKPYPRELNISNTVRIHQTIFHESGHYSHASKAGAWFWANVFASEISNTIATWGGDSGSDPYRDGSQPSYQAAKRIALAEGWARLTEFKIAKAVYGKAFFDGGSESNIEDRMENFDQLETPVTASILTDRSWFTHGIMWDLLDDRNEILNSSNLPLSERRHGNNEFSMYIVDRAFIGNSSNQYDLAPIFNKLTSNVNDYADFKNALLLQYTSDSQNAGIVTLFDTYYDLIP